MRREDPSYVRRDVSAKMTSQLQFEADLDACDPAEAETLFRLRLVHEQNVPLGAPRYVLVDRAGEQSLEKAVLAAADDDQVGIPLSGDLQQPPGRIAQLDDVFGLDVAARQRSASSLELPPRELLRLPWRYRFGQGHRSSGRDRWNGRGCRLERRNRRRSACQPAHADDEQSSREGLRNVSRAPKCTLGGVRSVVTDNDRLHA